MRTKYSINRKGEAVLGLVTPVDSETITGYIDVELDQIELILVAPIG